MIGKDTIEVYSEIVTDCVRRCASLDQCCVASYSDDTSTCVLDQSGSCCIDTLIEIGWRTIKKQTANASSTCTNCLVFDRSLYKIIDNEKNWQEAVDECKCQGGKLIEIETKKENDFILAELKTRNTGALGYWLGGYNFNNDFDLEWISNPGQDMLFDGTGVGEPNNPFTELCLAAWEDINFNWADLHCGAMCPYICEFSAD
ncbi:perlucin-like protein [Mytilus californianus]|uniref:perlucin-like protein n=1 Tax=Mytilus californianus TaxID=6549 RepID=UPI00224771AB|nr:perlucin-like protein [Mytilus californianus]